MSDKKRDNEDPAGVFGKRWKWWRPPTGKWTRTTRKTSWWASVDNRDPDIYSSGRFRRTFPAACHCLNVTLFLTLIETIILTLTQNWYY